MTYDKVWTPERKTVAIVIYGQKSRLMRPDATTSPLSPIHFQVEKPSAERMQSILPPLLSNLSLGRAQIALDQIRGCLADPKMGTLSLATCVKNDGQRETIAAAIAVISPKGTSPEGGQIGLGKSDTATIVHAGPVQRDSPILATHPKGVIAGVANALSNHFDACGVRFIQWATDPPAAANPGEEDSIAETHRWCGGFGLEPVATLDYLSGPVVGGGRSRLKFIGFDWSIGDDKLPRDWTAFAKLIEQTYSQTQDCPTLNRLRTAEQTMRGYAVSPSRAGQFWFAVYEPGSERESIGDPVGVLILGVHGPAQASDDDPPPVVELVYMGLVPAARGRGLGRSLLTHAMTAARTIGAERLILAVDQNNSPAVDHYRAAGLEPMLCEQVWCGVVQAR